jgi:hypothetical protein
MEERTFGELPRRAPWLSLDNGRGRWTFASRHDFRQHWRKIVLEEY